jgi:hypothetical protein
MSVVVESGGNPLPLAGEGGTRSVPGEGKHSSKVVSGRERGKIPSPPTPLPQAGEGRREAFDETGARA